jgi:hypothetical protein
MPDLNGLLRTVIHAAQAVLAVVPPVGARFFTAFHDHGLIRAGTDTQSTADAQIKDDQHRAGKD